MSRTLSPFEDMIPSCQLHRNLRTIAPLVVVPTLITRNEKERNTTQQMKFNDTHMSISDGKLSLMWGITILLKEIQGRRKRREKEVRGESKTYTESISSNRRCSKRNPNELSNTFTRNGSKFWSVKRTTNFSL